MNMEDFSLKQCCDVDLTILDLNMANSALPVWFDARPC